MDRTRVDPGALLIAVLVVTVIVGLAARWILRRYVVASPSAAADDSAQTT